MSGGRWGYQSYHLEVQGAHLKDTFDFLAAVEHEVDWAVCGDTCPNCAKNRLWEAIQLYFDGSSSAAIAVLRDHRQNECDEDAERRTRSARPALTLPSEGAPERHQGE